MNEIICIVGFTNAGKDTLAKQLSEELGYNFVISTTTRPIRENEKQGYPYHFVSNEVFEGLIDRDGLIEYRHYNTLVDNIPAKWYYGVENKEVKNNEKYVVVLDIVGLKGFKKAFGDRVTSIFLDVDEQTRKNRNIARGDFNTYEWERRAKFDRETFTPEVIAKHLDHVIKTDNNTDLLKQIKKILKNT